MPTGKTPAAVGAEVARPTSRWWQALRWFSVLYAVFAIWFDVDWALVQSGLVSHGDYGFTVNASGFAVGRLADLDPQGPAALAGLRNGEIVRALRPWDIVRTPSPGDVIHFEKQSTKEKVTLVAASRRALVASTPPIFYILICLPSSLIGLLILLRGRGQGASVLLGLGLAAYGLATLNALPPSLSYTPVLQAMVFWMLFTPVLQTGALLFLGVDLLGAASGAGRRWLWILPLVWALSYSPASLSYYAGLLGARLPMRMIHTLFAIAYVSRVVFDSIVGVLFISAWLGSRGNERKRLTIFVIAIVCLTTYQLAVDLNPLFGWGPLGDQWWFVASGILAGVAAPLLFAYAILRDRIVDLGFALNRTLVYSLVSAILLGAFGLIEWGVDHFLKIEGREKNALIDAAIALGVYLGFHRVTGVVEHAVETVFFRVWQEKEAKLRRFVSEAAFITRTATLTQDFAEALSVYADGAEVGVYLLGRDGEFRRASGSVTGVGKTVDTDDPLLVALRNEPKAVTLQETRSSLRATLAAPMLNRNDVIGVVLLGPMPNDADYRPDQVELIEWATRQVGFDLHALKVEQLDAREKELAIENRMLRSLVPGAA